MTDRTSIMPDALPAELARRTHYSYGVLAGDTLHISGMVAFDAEGNVVGGADIAAQVEQVFINMDAVVRHAGGTMADVVSTTTYLVNIADAPVVNEARARWFTGDVLPTHTVVGVAALARPTFMVEISAIAVIGR